MTRNDNRSIDNWALLRWKTKLQLQGGRFPIWKRHHYIFWSSLKMRCDSFQSYHSELLAILSNNFETFWAGNWWKRPLTWIQTGEKIFHNLGKILSRIATFLSLKLNTGWPSGVGLMEALPQLSPLNKVQKINPYDLVSVNNSLSWKSTST